MQVFRAIQFACPIDTASSVWQDDEEMPHNPATLLDSMSIGVANLLALVSSTAPSITGSPPNSVVDLLGQAKAIDGKLACWANIVPVNWFPISVSVNAVSQSVRDAGVYGDTCDIYPDIMVAITWNDWRWTRIRVLALIARYETGEQVLATIQRLADDICASVPFCLGDRTEMMPMYAAMSSYPSAEGQPLPKSHPQNASAFGGWYMLTPFRETVQVAKYLREGQLDWIRGQMQRLAKIYGVNQDD